MRMNQYSKYHLVSTVYMYTAERIIRILLDPSIDNSKVPKEFIHVWLALHVSRCLYMFGSSWQASQVALPNMEGALLTECIKSP